MKRLDMKKPFNANRIATCSKGRFFSFAIVVILAMSLVSGGAIGTGNSTDNRTDALGLQSPPPEPVLPQVLADYRFPKWPSHYTDNRLSGQNQLAATKTLRPGRDIDAEQLNQRATLGRVIFHDRSLSANQLVSCASCHSHEIGFDDPSRFSIGFDGRITSRHSMALANVALNTTGRQFWDGRASSLDEMMLHPFFDTVEMGLDEQSLIAAIGSRDYYAGLFQAAFEEETITTDKIADALASFVRAMVSVNSRYDIEAQTVDDPLKPFPGFTPAENRGKFLFFQSVENGGANCGTCHVSEAFLSHPGGPANIGLDLEYRDKGAGSAFQDTDLDGAFRSASLKNIAKRPPYMHDGRFETLEEVVEHYDNGVKSHRNLHPALLGNDNKPVRLDLSAEDRKALVTFLETLTDEVFLNDERFSNPFVQERQ